MALFWDAIKSQIWALNACLALIFNFTTLTSLPRRANAGSYVVFVRFKISWILKPPKKQIKQTDQIKSFIWSQVSHLLIAAFRSFNTFSVIGTLAGLLLNLFLIVSMWAFPSKIAATMAGLNVDSSIPLIKWIVLSPDKYALIVLASSPRFINQDTKHNTWFVVIGKLNFTDKSFWHLSRWPLTVLYELQVDLDSE